MTIKVERAEAPLASFYVEKQPWLTEAACLGKPLDPWFDAIDHREMLVQQSALKQCKATCFGCPVRKDCAAQVMLEEGAAAAGRYGYRAGMTPKQRQALHRDGGLKGRDPKFLRHIQRVV